MSPKASEPHSSKLHSWGTEPAQGPDPESLQGKASKSRISPNSSASEKTSGPESGRWSVRFTPPLCHTSICGFHRCRLSNLSGIYRLHHPRCASSAVIWRTKDARHRGKGLIVNMIIPSDAVISFVSEWHARARPHRSIWDQVWGEKVRKQFRFRVGAFAHLSPF